MVEACTGAGATAVAARLALALAERVDGVTYLESNDCGCSRCRRRNRAFYAAGLAGSLSARHFTDLFYLRFLGGKADKKLNLWRGVNWVLRTDESPCFALGPEDVAGRVVIWDDPAEPGSSDLILCVASAEADALAAEARELKELRQLYGSRLRLIINRVSSEAELARAEAVLDQKGDFLLRQEGSGKNFSPQNAACIADIAEYAYVFC